MRTNIVPLAIAFEAGLGLLGWGLAEALGQPLAGRAEASWETLTRATAATIPLLALLAGGLHSAWPPLVRLRRELAAMTASLFARARWHELALVSLAAGVGEETLFRGALQSWAVDASSPAVGIALTSLLFGALHAASTTYFVIATLMGGYLGWLAWRFDDLGTAMAVHAMYDFVALAALRRLAPPDEE